MNKQEFAQEVRRHCQINLPTFPAPTSCGILAA